MRTHNMIFRGSVVCLLLLVQLALSATETSQTTWQQKLEADQDYACEVVTKLASDEMQGRRVGEVGGQLAFEYIKSEMERIGLMQPGPIPNVQEFDVTRGNKVVGTPSLHLGGTGLQFGVDYTVAPFSGSGTAAGAPMVFAGYGIVAPDLNWNDYKDLDVKGAIVVIVRGEPQADDPESGFSGDQPSTYADLRRKASTARDLGAAGLLILNNPLTDIGDEFPEQHATYSSANFDIPALFVKRAKLDPLIKAGTGHVLMTLLGAMDRYSSPASTSLNVTGSLDIQVDRDLVIGRNLIGVIPGSDPALEDQYIVLGAHFDHLGIGGTESLDPHGYGEIHYGADDNGSGVAALLLVAEQLKLRSKSGRLKHSVLICFFDAEEIGVVGSRHLVDALPPNNVLAMLNFDMVGRLRENQLIIGGTATAAEFDQILREASAEDRFMWMGRDRPGQLAFKKESTGFGASDHINFVQKRIPSLFFFTGAHSDYHKPTDTADKVNYEGVAHIADFAFHVFTPLDDMGRLTFQEIADAAPTRNRGKLRVTLGTVPSYVDSGVEGMEIGDVVKGGPAEKAGLKAGDVIIRIADKKVGSIYDFMYALENREAGQVVEVEVLRSTGHVVVQVTLAARNVEQ
jgi:aminopeptidase YwaD